MHKSLFILSFSIVVFCGRPPPPPWRARPCKRECFVCELNPEIPQTRIREHVPYVAEEGCIVRINGQHSLGLDPHPLRLTRETIRTEQSIASESTFRCQFDAPVCR